MISYGIYRFVHFFGIFLLLGSLGGAVIHGMLVPARWRGSAGTAEGTAEGTGGAAAAARGARRLIGMSHGVALFLILLGGFGMLARLDIGMPGWIYGKLGVWLVLGAALAAARRLTVAARFIWFSIPLLGLVAAWLAYAKPI